MYRRRRRPLAIRLLPPTQKPVDKDTEATPHHKRKADDLAPKPKPKKPKIKSDAFLEQQLASSSSSQPAPVFPLKLPKVTLKLPPPPPKPKEETFPCCLCVSMSEDELLPVHDPPAWWYDHSNAAAALKGCMAHAECASIVPETWLDEVETGEPDESGVRKKERMVFGVDVIVKDRWNLVSTRSFVLHRGSLTGILEV